MLWPHCVSTSTVSYIPDMLYLPIDACIHHDCNEAGPLWTDRDQAAMAEVTAPCQLSLQAVLFNSAYIICIKRWHGIHTTFIIVQRHSFCQPKYKIQSIEATYVICMYYIVLLQSMKTLHLSCVCTC